MKFEDVLPAFREGKKIQRKTRSIQLHRSESESTYFTINGILADDWEIEEETPLPCPFCGDNATHNGQNLRVFCQNTKCHAAGPESRFKTEAIELWNKAKR